MSPTMGKCVRSYCDVFELCVNWGPTCTCSDVTQPAEGGSSGWFDWMPSWKPTSEGQLMEAERVVLKGE
jgi:hypothetical protein